MKWLKSAINGEVSLVKTFWPGAIVYVLLDMFYLQITGVAVVYKEKMYTNETLMAMSTLQLLRPTIMLCLTSVLLGLYTTLTTAAIWQAASKYPVKQWAFWPNLSFLSVLVCLVMTSAEIMFGLSTITGTVINILSRGGM